MRLSCQLVEKAWQMDNDVFIYAPDENTATAMSEKLWHWSEASFLPHQSLSKPIDQNHPESIVIFSATNSVNDDGESYDTSTGNKMEELIGRQHGLLINLAEDTPDWFSRFEVLCEFVYGDGNSVALKRNRYKFYKDRGYPLHYHDMTDRF